MTGTAPTGGPNAALPGRPAQMGQYPRASHLIAHLSDTHFLGTGADGSGRLLYDAVDTDSTVHRAMAQLEASGLDIDALVFTGDIADRGEPDAYRRVRDIVEASADRMGATLVWVMGNHDERAAFRTELLRLEAHDAPVDRVVDVNGLRVVSLDTSVPGYHHGEVTTDQLAWLRDVLSEPTEHGSLLALHHPPVPTALPLMTILELRDQTALAEVLVGSDVRAILGGHLHYATTGLFAGIPVSVAAATCYTIDAAAPPRQLTGVGGGQSINLVHVYADQVVHSNVPLGAFDVVTRFDPAYLDRMEGLSPQDRLEAFSRHAAQPAG
ncbi:phosphodiesterase [Cryobacterium adonitolivorans]|uniref:Phosphodiesterase n=1 Tax=Cryobacterium adonitolivorans TaxID=1259189 RepID=A0A4R8VZ81_9MICO|nr:phosphodiesterase [Cryobacterium adonitolivorans]TFB96192.1 phosphodiesterase [Cryobacterium adonitolivorans]